MSKATHVLISLLVLGIGLVLLGYGVYDGVGFVVGRAVNAADAVIPGLIGLTFSFAGLMMLRDSRADTPHGSAEPRRVRAAGGGMYIPPYWVRETREIAGMRFRLHGSSSSGMEEAREHMQSRLALQRAFHEAGSLGIDACKRKLSEIARQERDGDYTVGILEPTLEKLSERSLVTRNRYGAEVLNTTELCFVDIDSCLGFWEKLLLLSGADRRRQEARLLRDLEKRARREPDLGIRAYRTAGGWRLILTGEGLAPDSPRMESLFGDLQADDAYAALCRKQQCWRARLSPKPGRLGSLGRFPQRNASDTPAEGEVEWLERYREKSRRYTVCRLIATFGRECSHPLVAWHDERTGATKADWPLA